LALRIVAGECGASARAVARISRQCARAVASSARSTRRRSREAFERKPCRRALRFPLRAPAPLRLPHEGASATKLFAGFSRFPRTPPRRGARASAAATMGESGWVRWSWLIRPIWELFLKWEYRLEEKFYPVDFQR